MRPWQLLPAPEPCTVSPPEGYFYDTVAKHLIKDTVRIMSNGLPIDMQRVQELEATLDVTLAKVATDLAANPIIQSYLKQKHSFLVQDYIEDQQSKVKPIEHFLKPFKHSDMTHRSYFMHVFCQGKSIPLPKADEVYPGIPKWTARDVKRLTSGNPALALLLAGKLSDTNTFVVQAMQLLAEHKAEIHNRKYLDNIANLTTIEYPSFNPASPDQKHDVLTDMLGYQSEKLTDAYIKYERALNAHIKYGKPEPIEPKNQYSWDRDNIEALKDLAKSDDELNLFQSLIDYSMGSIIKNNFIQSFYRYTIDGRLHGQYVLLGAKSGRYTSKEPNMLNAPSTGSIYAKPIKRCFTAPPGYVVWSIDYAALEDRVIASLTRDTNKCGIFLQELDGHSLGAVSYFPDKISAEMTLTGDIPTDAAEFKRLVDAGNKTLKALRQDGKAVTFGLSYGCFPPKVAATLKIPLEEAEKIFNNYHQTLYPSITEYRENYVLKTVKDVGKIHLGLGFYMKSSKPDRDIRTLSNATCQFWSILTAIAINELHHRIDETFVSNQTIQVTSTIYDSIYGIAVADPEVLKWLNDNIIPIMVQDFMVDQTVHNEAQLEIGPDWASLHPIPIDATETQIQEILQGI